MPQPYSAKEPLPIMPYAPMIRPELGAHLGTIASLWSNIEVELGTLLAILLGASAEIGVAMYLSITSAPARKAAMNAAASLRLSEVGQVALAKVYKIIGTAQKQRNDVVHGVWTIAPDRPDALILVDASEVIEGFAQNWTKQIKGIAPGLLSGGWEPHRPRYLAYTDADFRNIETDIHKATSALTQFWLTLPSISLPLSPSPLPPGGGLLAPHKTTPEG